MTTCEDTLIERAAHRDQEAFRQLWEAHHAPAMAAALRLCHQRALAEEITQGAFLLAWRGLPRFKKGCPFRPWLMRILYRHALDVMDKQGAYLRPLSLDDALASAGLVGPERHLGQVDPQEQVAEWEAANRGKVRQDVTQLRELEASESIISPLVRPQLPPLAGLVIALRRLLKGKTPVEREREEACSHQPLLERSLREGRTGERLLHRLRLDEAEVIDPHPSARPQHPVEFPQGLL